MALIKTEDLQGAALDWAVAKCEGFDALGYENRRNKVLHRRDDAQPRQYTPSTDWAQAGPIIERESISINMTCQSGNFAWSATCSPSEIEECGEYGSTPVIAAMRCFVVSKLGEQIDVPDELLAEQAPAARPARPRG